MQARSAREDAERMRASLEACQAELQQERIRCAELQRRVEPAASAQAAAAARVAGSTGGEILSLAQLKELAMDSLEVRAVQLEHIS